MTEPLIPTEIDENEELRKATITLQAAMADPAMVAAENAKLRSSIRGTYALLHALVKRAGGDVTVRSAEYRAIPPIEQLSTRLDDKTGDVRLVIDSPGHRRKRR